MLELQGFFVLLLFTMCGC